MSKVVRHSNERVISVVKDPGSTRNYTLNYSEILAEVTPTDQVSSSLWAVDPVGEVTVAGQSNTTTTTTVSLAGGDTIGKIFWVKNTVATVGGQTHVWHIRVQIGYKIVPPNKEEEYTFS